MPKKKKPSTQPKVQSAKSKRIIVVSNRLPVTLSKSRDSHHTLTRSSGGLISAIEPLKKSRKLVWVGSLGPTKGNSATTSALLKQSSDIEYDVVNLDRSEWQMYYTGFSNKALWPLLHYFMGHCVFNENQWSVYKAVNQKFADKIVKVSRADDLIWIHDFHLMLVPSMVRLKKPNARIGFFLHTPFPSSELFRVFPWRKELLEGLLGADLIGFHTYDYVRHFRSSLLRILGLESEMTELMYKGRSLAIDAFPVGADVGTIESVLKKPKVEKGFEILKRKKGKLKIFLGVDRLDYTKGIKNRLEAYEHFLEKNPEWRGKVEFYQIIVPSRVEVDSYNDLKYEIDALAGRVNSRYGMPDWSPIRCFYRQLAIEDLVNYYAISDVAVVTPIRDGMNLVAKEYVLAQRPDSPGVLILSEFCGAVSELSDALIVNPLNKSEVVAAYKTALEIPLEDAKRRYRFMLKALTVYSAETWGKRFIETLSTTNTSSQSAIPYLDTKIQKTVKAAYKKAKKRVIFLDYDGTLTDIVSLPKFAMPNWEILRLVKKLVSDPKNLVMIVSGRPRHTLADWLERTGAHLCAEHGAWVWNGKEWKIAYQNSMPHWKDQIRPVLELYTTRTAGSFIEEKEEALAWHYRLSEPDYGAWQANNLAFNLESLLHGLPLQYLMGKKVVEVRHKDVNKGAAWNWVKKIKRKHDFIISIGDDRTDEDLFNVLPPHAHTVHVGASDSAAKYRVNTPADVRALLKFLSS
ncbi:MAG: trehalose 6-phosphate synthase/phosphatase [Candidatus Omnitrophota bacterium]|jgi:trehalose 6-phosphate synthase/phosphatase